MFHGKPGVDAHRGIPPVRDRLQSAIESGAHPLHKIGQRVAEILVFPTPESSSV
jgi:hypothetical protein